MVTRQQRINDFDSAGEPPAGELMELVCRRGASHLEAVAASQTFALCNFVVGR